MAKNIILKCECEWNGDYWDSLLTDDTYKGEYRGFAVSNSYGNNYMHGWTCSDDRLSDVLEAFNSFSGWAEDVENFMYNAGVKIAGNRTQFYKALTGSEDASENACNVLNLIFGGNWKYKTIHGCCQSDWADFIYNAAVISDSEVNYIESVYFNTGCELGVIENADSMDLEDIDKSDVDYWDYTDKYRNEDIAKHFGFDPADCVFMEEHSSMVRVSSFSVC